MTKEKSDAYEGNLHRLIQDLREDLGRPDLPFIVGNLAEFYGTGKDHRAPDRVRRIDKVRGVLRSLPDKVEVTGFVESTGCTSPDKHMVHFDRRSYIILGERYARVFATVTSKSAQDGAGQPASDPESKPEGDSKPQPEPEGCSPVTGGGPQVFRCPFRAGGFCSVGILALLRNGWVCPFRGDAERRRRDAVPPRSVRLPEES